MPVRSDDSPLRLKKRHFVRSEIWNAAVDLFAAHGYDVRRLLRVQICCQRKIFF